MGTPGFSLTDIIQAADTIALITVKLKEAPNDLRSVIKGIEFGRAVLKSWKRQLEHPENIHEDDLGLFVRVKADYDAIINQLEVFVKKHRKLENGGLGARFRWVITDHFLNERAGLENDLQNAETRIHTVLQTLSWGTGQEILRLGRANSIAQFCHSPEMLSQSPPLPSSASPTTPSPLSQPGFHWNSGFFVSSSTTQDGSNETVDRYGGARDVIPVRGASASTVATHHPSPSFSPTSSHSSRSARSSVATEYSLGEPISSVKPSSPSRPSPSATTIPSPILPPPMIERMPIKGEIRIWYRAKQVYYERVLRDLDIARIGGRGASEVQMTTRNGTEIMHRGCGKLTGMATTILPQQGDLPERVRKVDPRINYLIKFREQHELRKCPNGNIFSTGSPEYSFTNEKDYENFQTMIAGKKNVSNAETLTISNSSGDISDSQVLQIWDSKGTRTIRFFRNATDKKFSECKIVGLKPYYSKKKELRLEFRNGYDFDNFKKLKIVFVSESARERFEQLAQFSNG